MTLRRGLTKKIYIVGGIQYEFLGKTFFEELTEI
jgi:hypothetical protein